MAWGGIGLMTLALVGAVWAQPDGASWFREPPPPGPYVSLQPADLTAVKSFRADQPIVGTYLFYWYDVYSGAHVKYGDGGDACTTHPESWDDYSYRSPNWWRRQLEAMREAGIDFAALVYWGYPDPAAYRENWSFQGLPPCVQACDALAEAGEAYPKIALFYDTSTLQHNGLGRRIDLSTPEGKAWFYCSIRDFYSFIPPRHWAAIEGRPIILLYAPGFAAKQDPALFPYVRERFQRDFGINPYIIKQTSWQGEADNTCNWGAAVAGLLLNGCAAVGPGYNHAAVRGRQPLVVDRQGGQFYAQAWERLLYRAPARRPKIVMIETWNEFHEATDIAPSREYGRQYVELTRQFADIFHQGGRVEHLRGPYAEAEALVGDFSQGRENGGVKIANAGDGLTAEAELGGRRCIISQPNPTGGRYLYFALDDSFVWDLETPQPFTIEIEFYDTGPERFVLEYDSLDPQGSVHEGAFKANRSVALGQTAAWRRERFTLEDARFANRCNGSDFRLAIQGAGELAVARVIVRKGR